MFFTDFCVFLTCRRRKTSSTYPKMPPSYSATLTWPTTNLVWHQNLYFWRFSRNTANGGSLFQAYSGATFWKVSMFCKEKHISLWIKSVEKINMNLNKVMKSDPLNLLSFIFWFYLFIYLLYLFSFFLGGGQRNIKHFEFTWIFSKFSWTK